MDSWRKMPKVCKGRGNPRSGAANTKSYRCFTIWGSNGGVGEEMAMGMRYYSGPSLSAQVAAASEAEPPSNAGWERGASSGVAQVGYELHTSGIKRVYQRFVLGGQTGIPRFYGERW